MLLDSGQMEGICIGRQPFLARVEAAVDLIMALTSNECTKEVSGRCRKRYNGETTSRTRSEHWRR